MGEVSKISGFHGGDYEECRLLQSGSNRLTVFLARIISSTLKMEATRFSEM
jgi:hypothetical protein